MCSNPDLKRRREVDGFLQVGPTKRIQLPTQQVRNSCTREKITMMWARNVSPKLRGVSTNVLSTNVLREVCLYLGFISKVVALKSRKVVAFDVFSQKWETLSLVGLQVTGLYCYCFLNDEELFIGLVMNDKAPREEEDGPLMLARSSGYAKRVSFYMLEHLRLRDLCWKNVNCWEAGLLHDKKQNCLYFFGGRNFEGESLTCCSKVSFADGEWTGLSSMHHPRANFSPCWHKFLVFLCCGSVPSVETYDPDTNLFTIYPSFVVSPTSEATTSLSVSQGDELLLLANDAIVAFNTRTSTERRDTLRVPKLQLKGPPIVCRDNAYCLDCATNVVWKFGLRLGGFSEEMQIPFFMD